MQSMWEDEAEASVLSALEWLEYTTGLWYNRIRFGFEPSVWHGFTLPSPSLEAGVS